MHLVKAVALLLLGASHGQELEYLDPPQVLWTQSASPAQEGNGLYWSPDSSAVVGTFADGSLRAFSPSTGDSVVYTPAISLTTVSGLGGVTFSGYGPNATGSPYLVYAVADNPSDPATAQT